MNSTDAPVSTGRSRPASRPWYRRKRTWLGLVVVLLLGFIGAYYLQLGRARAMLREIEAELDAKDPNWRIGDLHKSLAPLLDEENISLRMVATAEKIPEEWTPNQRDEDGTVLDWTRLPPNEVPSHELVDELAEKVKSVVGLEREITRLPANGRGCHGITYSADTIMFFSPNYDAFDRLALALNSSAQVQAWRGDVEGGMESAEALLRLCRGFSDEYSLIALWRRNRFRREASRAAQRVVNCGNCSPPALERFANLLSKECEGNDLLIGLREERAIRHEMFKNIDSGAASAEVLQFFANTGFSFAPQNREPSTFELAKQRGHAYWRAVNRHHSQAKYLRDISYLIDHADLPFEKLQPIVEEMKAQAEAGDALPSLLTGSLVWVDRRFRSLAHARCTMVALAAERFRQKKGRWPASQAELVPEFLEKAVVDPFDVSKLVSVRLTDDGLVAFSVGPHRDKTSSAFDGEIPGSQTDPLDGMLEFRLWSPENRRAPARKRVEERSKDDGP